MDAVQAHDDLRGYYIEELSVGMTAAYAKTITEADILMYAGVSGDTNPIHLNEDFAQQSMFKGRIAHGMLSSSLISTVFGTKLPGPGAIYLKQDLRFLAPVRIGETVEARVHITEIVPEKNRVVAHTVCRVGDKVVVEGQALLFVPSAPAIKAAAE